MIFLVFATWINIFARDLSTPCVEIHAFYEQIHQVLTGKAIPDFHVIRSAYMKCTKRSCFENIDPGHKVGESRMDYLIKFIVVMDTPDPHQ